MSGSQSYIAAMIGTIAFVFMVMVAIRWPRKVFSALLGIFALMFVFALMLPAFHTTSRTRVRSVQRFDFDDELNHPTIRLDKSDGQDRVHRGHQDQTELQLIIQNRGDQVVIESSHAANSHLTSMSHHHDEFSEKSKEDESCEKCEADDGKQVCCDDDDDAIECDDDGDAKTTVVAVASTAPVVPMRRRFLPLHQRTKSPNGLLMIRSPQKQKIFGSLMSRKIQPRKWTNLERSRIRPLTTSPRPRKTS